MRPKIERHPTREALVLAARHMLTDVGWEATTVTSIRNSVDAAAGSASHFFPGGKLELGSVVYLELCDTLWNPVISVVTASRSLSEAKLAVSRALNELWRLMTEDRALANVFFELESLLPKTTAGAVVRSEHRRRVAAIHEWLNGPVSGVVKISSGQTAFAVLFGPALDMLRQWAAGAEIDVIDGVPVQFWGIAGTALFGDGLSVPRRRR